MSFIDELKKVNKTIGDKIKRIQRSDKSTKRKWLVGGSVILMIFIVFMWIGYLNLTLPQVASDSELEENQEPVAEESSSFFESVSTGASILYTKVEKGARNITDKVQETFKKKREFEFSN